jgi:hypothetical protein
MLPMDRGGELWAVDRLLRWILEIAGGAEGRSAATPLSRPSQAEGLAKEAGGAEGRSAATPLSRPSQAEGLAKIEGITLVGGEPFLQARACAELCEAVKEHGLSVMVFTGYTLEELHESSDGQWARLLATIDLLVDGRYERDRPDRRRRWIGSANQKVCFLSDRYAPNDPQFEEPNCVEIRLDGEGGLQVNGWPELAALLGSKAGGETR